MDVFKLRDTVVREYRDYVESFVRVFDQRIDEYVRTQLEGGELWPEVVLQLNPAFELDHTLGELADAGTITRDTARFFGEDIRLYRHQREALTAEISSLKESNAELASRVDALKTDPDCIERLAREQGMVKDGETVYQYEGE